MFPRFCDIESFDARAIRRGLSHLRCALAAIVTDVSVIPFAIFAMVFPVQGAIISSDKGDAAPSGSASSIVCIGLLPVMSVTVLISSFAEKKRVSTV